MARKGLKGMGRSCPNCINTKLIPHDVRIKGKVRNRMWICPKCAFMTDRKRGYE